MRLLRRLSALLMALLMQIPGFAAEAYDLNAQNICADTHFLCEEIGVRPAGSPQERAAGDWIVARLGELGYSADAGNLFRTEFVIPGGSSENIGVLVNPDAALPLIAIVAHYDSAPTTPGARDNAASVAILLEIARHLSESGAIQGCELHLVFLGSEENGFHGAQAYLDSLTAQARARLIGAFNMDVSVAGFGEDAQPVLNLLGGKNAQGEVVDAAYLPALENGVTRCVVAACRELYGREIGGTFYHGESDHVPFQNAGIEAANLCWRRIEDGRPMLPDCYHSMQDTADHLDWDSAVLTGRCILRAAELLAAESAAAQ